MKKHNKQARNLTLLPHRSILLLSMGLLLVGCEEQAPPDLPRPVKAFTVLDSSGLSESTFPGLAAAADEANMSFRVAGPLVNLPVKVGDNVSAGSVIAQIDPNDYEVRLNTAQALLDGAVAANRRAEADYSRLKSAQEEDPGATSQRAVDLSLALRDESRAAVASARSAVQTATDRLSYTTLVAPFDGDVVETYVENFETVIPLQPIVRLVDSKRIEMTLAVPENLIGYVEFVTDISVTFDALPDQEFVAEISEVGAEASQVTRTYPVTISVAQQEADDILPGMAGHALVSAQLPQSSESGLHVPASALFTDPQETSSFVWLIENGKVTRRAVQAGDLTDVGVVITSGLAPGDQIVRAGVGALLDGQSVRVVADGEGE